MLQRPRGEIIKKHGCSKHERNRRLTKKNVLITGASRGLGKELAQVFAEGEYNLILHSKEKELPCIKKKFTFAREHTNDYGVYCETVTGDITLRSTQARLYDAADCMGGVDVLINNAGIHVDGAFEDVASINYEESLKVNLLAPMLLTKVLWDTVKRRKGLVLFINSIGGKVGAKNEFLYCATKHGLKGFADSIQFDATKAGVNVVSAYLGAMATDMSKGRENFDKMVSPREAAQFLFDVCKNYPTMRVTEVDVCRRVY